MGGAHRGSARLLLALSRLLRDALTAILPSVGLGAHSCLRAHPTGRKSSAVEEDEPDGQRKHVERTRLLRTAAPRDDGRYSSRASKPHGRRRRSRHRPSRSSKSSVPVVQVQMISSSEMGKHMCLLDMCFPTRFEFASKSSKSDEPMWLRRRAPLPTSALR